MTKPLIICLCDKTGIMAQPFIERGWGALLIDPQHPPEYQPPTGGGS